MRHRKAHRKLGRTSSHRSALFRNQLTSMIDKERIVTTLPKAKELRPLVEKMVTHAKEDSVHRRRLAARSIARKDVLKKLFDELAPRFADRPGGYTRIVKLGPRRGDGAEMAILEFVDFEIGAGAPAPEPKKKTKAAKEEPNGEEPVEEVDEDTEKKKPAKKAGSRTASKKPAAAKGTTSRKSSKKSPAKSSAKSPAKKASKSPSKKSGTKSSTKSS